MLASYTGVVGNTDVIQATGADSEISAPLLGTIAENNNNYYSYTEVQALAGASVQLPGLTQVGGGPVLLEAEGASSQLNVSAMTSFSGNYGQQNFSTILQDGSGGWSWTAR